MSTTRRFAAALVSLLLLAGSTASAQWVVTDPATTARNTVTAALKSSILETLVEQHGELRRMARRLSAFTDLRKYATPDPPLWRIHDFETFLFANGFHAALNYGDPTGAEYARIARARTAAAAVLSVAPPAARDVITRGLATMDVADSSAIAATHQIGTLRYNGRREITAIRALESHVVDGSEEQSATAVLDKISGAVLIGTRQKQARLQFLAALVEQLLIDNKRARDTEAAMLNMRLGHLRASDDEGGHGLLTGSASALRAWRQP
jgi:hypothetical protein